jgi:hypothetical protein
MSRYERDREGDVIRLLQDNDTYPPSAGGGSGDVVGPASATDNALARYDGTTGKLLQNSGAVVDDSGNLTATNLSGTNTGDVPQMQMADLMAFAAAMG